MKKHKVLIFFFIVTAILNYFYGSILYSKVLGKEEAYTIGKLCVSSRTDCENAYFKDYLNKIDSLSNENRFGKSLPQTTLVLKRSEKNILRHYENVPG
jgi:hypothetical protein